MAEGDQLLYHKTFKDGRVQAINVWRTGKDVLIFDNQAAFERAKEAVEKRGETPTVRGYTPIGANS